MFRDLALSCEVVRMDSKNVYGGKYSLFANNSQSVEVEILANMARSEHFVFSPLIYLEKTVNTTNHPCQGVFMPTTRKTKFLECIPSEVRHALELEEKNFILKALSTRKRLLETIEILLSEPDKLSIKDLATALKVIQEQLHNSVKEYSLLSEAETEEIGEIIEIPESTLSSITHLEVVPNKK